jgi:hypothetical protein
MGQAWWSLALTAAGVAGIGYLGWVLTRAIWTGRPPRRVPLSASILVALITAYVLSGQRPTPSPTLVAAATVAQPSCIITRGAAVPLSQSGERVTLTGSDEVRADCTLWAIITDPRTGERWAQGPANQSAEGWSLTLVLGTGQPAVRLPYLVNISAFETDADVQLRAAASSVEPLAPGAIPSVRDELMRGSVVEIIPG